MGGFCMKSKKFKGFFEEVKRFGINIDYLKDFIYDYLDAYANREYNTNQHEDLFQQALANGLNVQPYISLIKGWEIQYDKKQNGTTDLSNHVLHLGLGRHHCQLWHL